MTEQTVKLRNGKTVKVNVAETPQATVEVVCWHCHGTGLCACDCGHEHDCGECDGKGNIEKPTAKVDSLDETTDDAANREQIEALLIARYGNAHGSHIADFWTGAR